MPTVLRDAQLEPFTPTSPSGVGRLFVGCWRLALIGVLSLVVLTGCGGRSPQPVMNPEDPVVEWPSGTCWEMWAVDGGSLIDGKRLRFLLGNAPHSATEPSRVRRVTELSSTPGGKTRILGTWESKGGGQIEAVLVGGIVELQLLARLGQDSLAGQTVGVADRRTGDPVRRQVAGVRTSCT
jgi:hypothetical protein